MGEVHRARDPRLGREVAIKVLSETFASDRDRLSRFEQEARAASALNHPGIVTIYEIGRVDSISYIAMELVAGSTLREVLSGGPLPVKRLLAIAAPAADALARAHEAGIVHRDLKPENLMVTRDGFVKVLDFGLAKLVPANEGEASALLTIAAPTQSGIIMGTVGYMSPEQASGKRVDFRSDQFALGAIFYEMATGRSPFLRSTAAESMVATIREEPEPIGARNPQVPVPLRWVIERCLAKDPEERYASTRDLARDLKRLDLHASELGAGAIPAVERRPRGRLFPAVATGLALTAALAAVILMTSRRHDEPPAPPVLFQVAIPPGMTYERAVISRQISISPDGTRLGIEVNAQGHRRLHVRPLHAEESVEIEGTLDGSAHFWSPDSRSIAFYAGGKLKKVPATGGPAEELCGATLAMVGTWNEEGTILFGRIDVPGIYRVSDRGGEPVRILAPEPEERGVNYIWPQFLPDGRRFLFIKNVAQSIGPDELRVGSLDSKETRSVGPANSRVEYSAPGFLLFVREDTLFAQPFDERAARFQGEPRRLAVNVDFLNGPQFAPFSISRTGVLAYETAPHPSRLLWVDREGKEVGRIGDALVVKGLQVSRDGAKVALDLRDARAGSSDLWVFEVARGVLTRIDSDPSDEVSPVWTADGSHLIYRSDRRGPPDIYQLTPGVPGSERPLLEKPAVQQPEDVSADGRLLVYLDEVATSMWNIRLLPLDGQPPPAPWPPTRFNQESPRFSGDGRWIAYESDESGDHEVYLALTEGGAEKRRISPSGGRRPRWRRDGTELYYLAPGGLVMKVPVAAGPQAEAGEPAMLFHSEPEIENYDVLPDGSRFLLAVPPEKLRGSPLRVIVNWPALVQEKG
jgi:eukaryotic-like serine/threonine-protein kinase